MSAWPKRNKFRAVRTNGFASKFESAVHDVLVIRERAGEIRNIKMQQGVNLLGGIRWKIDFSFEEKARAWSIAYAEAKGVETADYRIKLKLFKADPPAPLEIWKGNYKRPKMVERIEAKNGTGI